MKRGMSIVIILVLGLAALCLTGMSQRHEAEISELSRPIFHRAIEWAEDVKADLPLDLPRMRGMYR